MFNRLFGRGLITNPTNHIETNHIELENYQ